MALPKRWTRDKREEYRDASMPESTWNLVPQYLFHNRLENFWDQRFHRLSIVAPEFEMSLQGSQKLLGC